MPINLCSTEEHIEKTIALLTPAQRPALNAEKMLAY